MLFNKTFLTQKPSNIKKQKIFIKRVYKLKIYDIININYNKWEWYNCKRLVNLSM